MDHNLEIKNSEDKCFLCKQFLQIGHVNNQIKGVFCLKCAETYDPNIFPIPNKVNSAYYDKIPDGAQNTCTKILGAKNQHWYHCETCFSKKKEKGYCIYCSKKCLKKNHTLQLRYCAFICDSK